MEFEVWFAVDHRTSECSFVAASNLLAHRPRGSRTILRVSQKKNGSSGRLFRLSKASGIEFWLMFFSL